MRACCLSRPPSPDSPSSYQCFDVDGNGSVDLRVFILGLTSSWQERPFRSSSQETHWMIIRFALCSPQLYATAGVALTKLCGTAQGTVGDKAVVYFEAVDVDNDGILRYDEVAAPSVPPCIICGKGEGCWLSPVVTSLSVSQHIVLTSCCVFLLHGR